MTIDINSIPPLPNRNQAGFSDAVDAFITWFLNTFPEEFNDSITALNLNSTNGTSATSNSVGTGAKTFTANTAKSWQPGMWVAIADTAAPSTNYMIGPITSYNSGTGALVVNVAVAGGSGTKSAWTISQSAPGGATFGANTFAGLQTFAASADIATAATVNLTAATGNIVTLTGTTAVGAFTMNTGQVMWIVAESAFSLTYNATTMNVSGGRDISLAAGDCLFAFKDIDNVIRVRVFRQNGASPVRHSPRGYISGMVVSINATDPLNDVDISAGCARNTADTFDINNSATIIKRLDAAFAAGTGNGGLGNAVSKPTSGTLHIFAITNNTTNAVDYYADTSASAANVPSGWTAGRRVSSLRTDSSGNLILIRPIEIGGGAVWNAYDAQRTGDIADTSVTSAARETYALTIPAGVRMLAKITAQLLNPDGNGGIKFFDLATADAAVALDNGTMSLGGSVSSASAITGVRFAGEFEIMTDTSGQIGARAIALGTDLYANTIGYTDFRTV